MTIREELIQAIRNWLMLAAGLSDAQVIKADRTAVGSAVAPPRPALPYLTVKITSHDIPVGEDEEGHTIGYLLTVTGGDEDDVLTVTINGAAVTYTITEDDTPTTAAAGLAAAIVAADPDAFATSDGAVLTISNVVGTVTVAETDPNLSLDADTVPVEYTRGTRRAMASVTAYGEGGEAWLSTAVRRLRMPSIVAQNETDGVSIRTAGGTTDMSGLVQTSIEIRHLLEVELDYGFTVGGETMVALGTIVTSYTGERIDSDPAPYTTTITVDLEA